MLKPIQIRFSKKDDKIEYDESGRFTKKAGDKTELYLYIKDIVHEDGRNNALKNIGVGYDYSIRVYIENRLLLLQGLKQKDIEEYDYFVLEGIEYKILKVIPQSYDGRTFTYLEYMILGKHSTQEW